MNYDALTDPHLSTYFARPPIKTQIRKYLAAARAEEARHHPSTVQQYFHARVSGSTAGEEEPLCLCSSSAKQKCLLCVSRESRTELNAKVEALSGRSTPSPFEEFFARRSASSFSRTGGTRSSTPRGEANATICGSGDARPASATSDRRHQHGADARVNKKKPVGDFDWHRATLRSPLSPPSSVAPRPASAASHATGRKNHLPPRAADQQPAATAPSSQPKHDDPSRHVHFTSLSGASRVPRKPAAGTDAAPSSPDSPVLLKTGHEADVEQQLSRLTPAPPLTFEEILVSYQQRHGHSSMRLSAAADAPFSDGAQAAAAAAPRTFVLLRFTIQQLRSAINIQRWYRGWSARIRIARRQAAARTIQRALRRFFRCRHYSAVSVWMLEKDKAGKWRPRWEFSQLGETDLCKVVYSSPSKHRFLLEPPRGPRPAQETSPSASIDLHTTAIAALGKLMALLTREPQERRDILLFEAVTFGELVTLALCSLESATRRTIAACQEDAMLGIRREVTQELSKLQRRRQLLLQENVARAALMCQRNAVEQAFDKCSAALLSLSKEATDYWLILDLESESFGSTVRCAIETLEGVERFCLHRETLVDREELFCAAIVRRYDEEQTFVKSYALLRLEELRRAQLCAEEGLTRRVVEGSAIAKETVAVALQSVTSSKTRLP